VPDAASLDPQANDITLTARVRVGEDTTTHQMDDDSYDIVRKGFVDTPGGDYKMEIKRSARDHTVGKLHCFFRGDQASVARIANRDVVDGNWHTLECAKTGTSVVARVDEGRSFTTTGSTGLIDNASNVMVGAKTVTVRRGVERGDDVFEGSMDFVSIDIAQDATQ
jgi:laminin G domain protein